MRIGLFGGSFDPVHQGHRALADQALRECGLDELRWIPAGQPWQKPRRLADADHRLAMIRLAMGPDPRQRLDERELRRTGPSYTLDTVRELQAEHPGATLVLILGEDQLANLPTWHGWQALAAAVTLAVATRGGREPVAPPALAAVPHHLHRLAMPAVPASSTEARERLERGEPAAALVPALVSAAVAGYIDRHGLYRAALERNPSGN